MNKAKLDRWILGEDKQENEHAAFHRREAAYRASLRYDDPALWLKLYAPQWMRDKAKGDSHDDR